MSEVKVLEEVNHGMINIKFDEQRYTKSFEAENNRLPEKLQDLEHSFEWPFDPSSIVEIGQFYGEFLDRHNHPGIDLNASMGTPVLAPHGGELLMVEDKDRNKEWGVSLADIYLYDENKGLLQTFGHLDLKDIRDRISRSELGRSVKKGQTIGVIGEFQNKDFSNPHLHYELSWSKTNAFVIPLVEGRKYNPLLLLKDLRKGNKT